MSGFIELAVIAVLVAWLGGKIRKRFNMATGRSFYRAVIVIFVLVALALWATRTHG